MSTVATVDRTSEPGPARPAASDARRRCLFVSTVDHGVDRGGGATVTRNLIALLEALPRPFDVDYLPLSRGYGRWRRLHQLRSLLQSATGPLPAKLNYFRSRAARRDVASRLQAARPDLIVIDHADLLWLLPDLPAGVPGVLVAHNVEHALQRRRLESGRLTAGPWGRWLAADCAKLEAAEAAGARRLGRVVALTPEDAAAFEALAPGVATLALAPGFAYPPFARLGPPSSEGLKLGFLGNCDWWPNAEGLDWFVAEVLPRLPDEIGLEVFGRGSERYGAHPRVAGHGFVDDIATVWRGVDLMIAPILSGSGVNVKTAEGLYNAMPVLATRLALRGLPIVEDPAIAVADGAEAWARLLGGPEARALAARRPMAANREAFSLAVHSEKLQAFLER